MAITDLDISYGAALAPAGFHKITLPDGGKAELNRGSGKSPSFLWYHDGAGRGDPIVEIKILHGEGDPADGFVKVSRDVLKGCEQSAYIAYRRSKEVDPIGEIRIIYGNAETEADFQKIATPIIGQGDDAVYLACRWVSKDAPVKWSGFSLSLDDWCDAQDNVSNWCVAQVVAADTSTVRLHFKGWASKWDETLSRASNKLAELGTHTSGKDTGWAKRLQGQACKLAGNDILALGDRLRQCMTASQDSPACAEGDVSPASASSSTSVSSPTGGVWEQFWRVEVVPAVEAVLTSAFPDPADVPIANNFLREVIEALVKALQERQFNMGRHQLLSRILMLDDNFTWFYSHYGLGIAHEDSCLHPADLMLEGPVCKLAKSARSVLLGGGSGTQSDVSKLLITNINYFAYRGGFDALSRLIDPPVTPASGRVSLAEVHSLVSLICAASVHFCKKFSSSFLSDFQISAFRRVSTISNDADLREILDSSPDGMGIIEDIWKELASILRTHWRDYPLHETFEKYELEFSRVLMTSHYLNLRIRGLALLNDLLNEIHKKETTRRTATMNYYAYTRQNTPEPVVQWLTSTWTCRWIAENSIIELILGDEATLKRYALKHTHDELLKRSLDVLVFVANRGKLQQEQVLLLWNAAGKSATPLTAGPAVTANTQSSTTTRTVYKVLSQLSARLSADHLAMLLRLVKTISCPINEEKVELIRGVAEGVLSKGDSFDDSTIGLPILWDALMLDGGSAPPIPPVELKLSRTQEAAVGALASLLSKPTLRTSLKGHLARCVEVIRGGGLVSTSGADDVVNCGSNGDAMQAVCAIQLLRKIIELQPEASRGLPAKLTLSREKIIGDCEADFKMLRAVMLCIGRSLRAASGGTAVAISECADRAPARQSSPATAEERNSRACSRQLLHACMGFLEFILINSNLEIDFSAVSTLWKQYEDYGTPEDMENGFFSWVQKACTDSSALTSTTTYTNYYYNTRNATGNLRRKCLSEEAVVQMLMQLFGERDPPDGIDMATLGEEGYEALEKIFRHVNGQAKNITYPHNKTTFLVRVMPTELIGLPILLRAFLRTQNVQVANTAKNFLTLLQIKLDATLDRKKAYPLFTKYCIDHIHQLAAEVDDAPTEEKKKFHLAISRMLHLLRQFFLDICSPSAVTLPAVSATNYYRTNTGPLKNAPFHLTVYWRREGVSLPANQKVVYIFKRGVLTVGSLRSRLAKDFKVPVQLVRLINSSRAFLTHKQDDQLVEACGVSSFLDAVILRVALEDTVHAKQSSPAITLAEDPESDQMYPRKTLSNSKTHLSLIFELLSHPSSDVSQSAWNLLDLLPINADMLAEMKTLGGAIDSPSLNREEVSWETLLSEGGILRQQYKLKIITVLLAPLLNDYAPQDDRAAAVRWREAFVARGGGHYLLRLMMDMILVQGRQHSLEADLEWDQKVQCLSSLLELLDHFLVSKAGAAAASLSDTGVKARQESDIRAIFREYTQEEVVLKLLGALFVISRDADMYHDIGSVSGMGTPQRHRSNSCVEELSGGHYAAQAKQRRKRSRAARFEQYFSSATKNTSTAVSMPDSRNDSSLEGSDDDGGSAGTVNHAAVSAKYALAIVTSVSARTPSVLDVVKKYPNLRRCLYTSLLQVPDDSFRDTFCKGLLALCASSINSGDVSLSASVAASLLSFLREVTHSHLSSSKMFDTELFTTEYFFTLAELCRLSVTSPSPLFADDALVAMGNELCAVVLSYDHCEASEEEDEEDKLMQGVLLLFAAFLMVPRGSKNRHRAVKAQIGCAEGIILCLFNSYLFHVDSGKLKLPEASLPRCKAPSSRQRAFTVLAELSTGCEENLGLLLDLVQPHHSITAEPSKAENKKVVSASKSLVRHGRDVLIPKSRTGYCGLQNPGCICYMNSTLQQLFMVPAFRYGVLGAETGITSLTDPEADDDVLFQLQLLFAYLQESNKAYVDPTGFSAAFKDYEGQPTDVLVQQDASEFMSNFFQQVEGSIMGTKLESLLKDTFGGMFSNELLAEGGKHSERAEPFFMISVGVGQGKNSLEAALECFIEGETVDYTWETEVDGPSGKEIKKESLSTVKRVSIRSLPNHLIIHLKRFEFDFESMQQIKINEKFAFPLELDMFPYTAQGRQNKTTGQPNEGDESSDDRSTHSAEAYGSGGDEDGYDYELAGVVVHVGTAHSGHYYSYVKERGGDRNRRPQSDTHRGDHATTGAQWFEFNDSFVSEFDIDDLEDECFGGMETWSGAAGAGGAQGGAGVKQFEKARNAFMLVYDRKKTKKLTGSGHSSAEQLYPPTLVTEAILQDNDSFWRTKSIFNAIYYKFLNNLLMNPSYEVGLDQAMDRRIVQCAARVTFGTLTQARERERVSKWCTWIVNHMIRRSPSCGVDLLKLLCSAEPSSKTGSAQGADDLAVVSSEQAMVRLQLKSLLLDVEDAEVRNSLMRVILVALEVIVHSPHVGGGEGSTSGEGDACSDLCLTFAAHIMSLSRVAQIKWHNISVFFSPIAHLAERSSEMKQEIRRRRYLDTLLSVFLASDTPYPELVGGSEPANHKSRSMTDGYTLADCRSLLRAIAALLCDDTAGDADIRDSSSSSAAEGGAQDEPVHMGGAEDCSWISEQAMAMLDAPVFSYRLMKTLKAPEKKKLIAPILTFVVRENPSRSKMCVDMVVNFMRKEDGENLKAPLRGAMLLCQVEDSLQDWRTELVMQLVTTEMQACAQYAQATDVSLTMLLRLCKSSQRACDWLCNNRESLRWMEIYLTARKSGGYPTGTTLLKSRRGVSSTHAGGYSTSSAGSAAVTSPAVIAAANLSSLKSIHANRTPKGTVGSSSYDSDDDPMELVGKRVKIRWAERDYPGAIVSYNEDSRLHTIHYDDGDTKASNLRAKIWAIISP